jgi:hypothetical protein
LISIFLIGWDDKSGLGGGRECALFVLVNEEGFSPFSSKMFASQELKMKNKKILYTN